MTKKEIELFQNGLDEYPISTVIIENLFIFLWIAAGTFLCWVFVPVIGWIYLGFGLMMVLFVMRILVCKNCYYHGKRCHTGWGKLSAIYCEQGELNHFCCGIGGAIVPLFYGSMALLPLILAVLSMVKAFSLITMFTTMVFIFIVVTGSFTFRKKACVVCKMRIMCPGYAEK